jgi:hypothetical protein
MVRIYATRFKYQVSVLKYVYQVRPEILATPSKYFTSLFKVASIECKKYPLKILYLTVRFRVMGIRNIIA